MKLVKEYFGEIVVSVLAVILVFGLIQFFEFAAFKKNEEFHKRQEQAKERKKRADLINQCILERYNAKHVGFGYYESLSSGVTINLSNTESCLEGWTPRLKSELKTEKLITIKAKIPLK